VKVKPDLAMISFESRVMMNDKVLEMTGKIEGQRLVVDMQVEGENRNQAYPIENSLFHSSAISLMPALKGLKEGQENSFAVFNSEKQAIEQVEQNLSPVKNAPGPSERSPGPATAAAGASNPWRSAAGPNPASGRNPA